jgi:secreted trypsin-like serine protease
MPSCQIRGLTDLRIVVMIGAMVPALACAGTIRHDRSDQVHKAGANDPALAAVVQLLVNGSPSCSGTLIAQQWVLTAAHCIWTRPTSPVYATQTIVVAGQRFQVGPDDIFIHPEWVLGGFDVGTTQGDIALIKLPRAVSRVTPIALNRTTNEVGQDAFIAGFGTTGTGLTGNTQRTAVKRMGANVIDATVATISFPDQFPFRNSVVVGSARALLTDFDNPSRNVSTLGGSTPVNLEYTSAPGDSGGPLLLFQNRVFSVAGVTSGGIDGFAGTVNASSFYSDTATFTRVASYVGWIDNVMKGRGFNIRQYLQALSKQSPTAVPNAATAYRERQAALLKSGWRLQHRRSLAPSHEALPVDAAMSSGWGGESDSVNYGKPVGIDPPDHQVLLEGCQCDGSP